MTVSASTESRLNAVDDALQRAGALSERTATDLFAIADAIDSSAQLRRTLTDPAIGTGVRQGIAARLFQGKVDPTALNVLTQSLAQPWPSGRALAAALDRQGVRAVLILGQQANRLDEIEGALFRFGRIVDADRPLRAALSDSSTPVAKRQQLVRDLLTGKVPAEVVTLAERAVAARHRTFDLTVEQYLSVSAALRRRTVATVRVARPLSPEQEARLAGALTRQVGRAVNVMVVVDPALIGGVKVELGDELIDGSVAGRLQDADRQLA